MTLLHPHPALKAVSEQASPADQWMNDDDHRYGALRLSYAFEYAVMEQADKNENTHFNFDIYDTYEWYLKLGPVSNINAKYLHDSIPYWNDTVEHPDYDAFWKREAWVNQLHASPVPNLNVAGFWDQEDPWGPVADLPPLRGERSAGQQLHGRRSVVPRPMAAPKGEIDRPDPVRRARHRARVPREYRSAVLPLLSARQRREVSLEGEHLSIRLQHLAHLRRVAAEASEARRTSICMPTGRSPSTRRQLARRSSRNMFPIQRTRCPIASGRSRRPIQAATGGPGKWPTSALSITGRTSSAMSARRSISDLIVTGHWQRSCSRPLPEPTAISW